LILVQRGRAGHWDHFGPSPFQSAPSTVVEMGNEGRGESRIDIAQGRVPIGPLAACLCSERPRRARHGSWAVVVRVGFLGVTAQLVAIVAVRPPAPLPGGVIENVGIGFRAGLLDRSPPVQTRSFYARAGDVIETLGRRPAWWLKGDAGGLTGLRLKAAGPCAGSRRERSAERSGSCRRKSSSAT